jgi:molecular chaperone GrpE
MNPSDDDASGLSIDIDDDVIAAALAAVERRSTGDAAAPTSASAPVEAEAEGLREELARVRARLDEAAFGVRRTEQRAGVAESRAAAAESALADLRAAHDTLTGDFERSRARARRDAEEAERKAEDRVLQAVLELADNLARAVAHAEADPASVLDGLRMMDAQTRRSLGRLGLERVEASRGTPFDPSVHEAVASLRCADVPEGAVIDELSAGYRLRGRLVRPARVTVAGARGPSRRGSVGGTGRRTLGLRPESTIRAESGGVGPPRSASWAR